MKSYNKFIATKERTVQPSGFTPDNLPDWLYGFQKHMVSWALEQGKAAIFADCGLGKGQPLDSPVLTPSGFIPIGKLNIGDKVIASSGRSHIVKGIYPRGEQDTYRIWFSDKSSLVVDTSHLHICRTNNDRQRNRPWRVMSTSELLTCNNLRYGADNKSRNYDIPIVGDVEFNSTRLPIDPYILGVLIGDGYMKGNILLSSSDREILAKVRKKLPKGVSLRQKSAYDWRFITGLCGTKKHPFRQSLSDMGLLNKLSATKFIPNEYLHASPSDRLELLRGLMDTDGYIGKEGTCQFYSVSAKLADNVIYLLRSLGGVPTLSLKNTTCNGNAGQPCHVVTFSLTSHNPFYLPRKASKWNSHPRDNGRWIDRIEYEKKQPTVCIAVDSPDSSYVTDNFIVTHNTPCQLAWADKVASHQGGKVLIITPLAVSHQTVREGTKFGVDVTHSRTGETGRITTTNYERLRYFKQSDFVGVVLDESSILKNYSGSTRQAITDFMRTIPYRLLCTATPAPNDHMELGTSAEALGVMRRVEMLGVYFTHNSGDTQSWVLKGHAEKPFWRWMASWSRACRKPSDLGYDDGKFTLPDLHMIQHTLPSEADDGMLFAMEAKTLNDQRAERRRTLKDRCAKVAELANANKDPFLCWCSLNDESATLAKMIPGAVEVCGSDTDEHKEKSMLGFSDGSIRVLITKPSIAGFGMNWQHCNQMSFFPSHSHEQFYQATRRCWRFGQEKEVTCHIVTTEAECMVLDNMKRKEKLASKMFAGIIDGMKEFQYAVKHNEYNPSTEMELPSWLLSQ